MADAFADWTRRLRASETRALNELMEALHPVLLGYAVRITGDRDAAYDILQEAFIKLWRVRDTLDPERSLKALVYRIVYTLALNYNRGKKRETMTHATLPAESISGSPTPEEEMDARRLGERMSAWIDELPPRRQEAFRLSRFEGLSHEEIAQVMDLTPQTVTKHIMLALQFLRDRFRGYKASEQGL